MLNFLTYISTTFSKQAVKALARLCVCAWADSEGDMGSGPRLCVCAWADSEGGMGSGRPPPPLKNHKTIGFSSNTGMDLLKKTQGYQARLNVGPSLVRQPLPSSTKKKNNKKKRCQSRTPSGKTFWIRAKCANSSEPSLRSDL